MHWPFRRRRDREHELTEELGAHLEMAIRDRVARGETLADATAAARREFGNLGAVREVTRDQWGAGWLDHLTHDLRIAARSLARSRVFAGFAIVTLALAIAANTVVYSVVDALLFPHVPFDHPERLIRAHMVAQHTRFAQTRSAYDEMRDGGRTFEPPASGSGWGRPEVVSINGTPFDAPQVYVSSNYFDVLRVRPKYGRLFSGTSADQEQVVVISEGLWHRISGDVRAFAPFVLSLGAQPYTVVGVLPHRGALPDGADVFIPSTYPTWLVGTLLRLRLGATPEMALAELNVIAAHVDEEHVGFFFQVSPAIQAGAGQTDLPAALIAATLALLLIACANVANLLIARGLARSREIATRLALGASRAALVRWLFAESAMVAGTGGVLGTLLALWGERVLAATLPPDVVFLGLVEPQLSGRVIAVALALTCASALAFGLVPALVLANADASVLLKSGGGSTPNAGRRARFRVLVSAEIASAMTLLVAASLMASAARYIHTLDLGYDARNLVAGYVQLGPVRPQGQPLDTAGQRAALTASYGTLERLRADPSVESASAMWGGDGSFYSMYGVASVTTQDPTGGQSPQVLPMVVRWVSPDIMRTMRLRIVRGRGFDIAEPSAVTSVVLDERAARRLWPDSNAVGRQIRFGTGKKSAPWGPWMRVVGIMRNPTLSVSPTVGPNTTPTMFVALGPGVVPDRPFVEYVVRVSRNPGAFATQLRQILANEAPDKPSFTRGWSDETGLGSVRTYNDFVAALFGTFAVLGVLLALIGVNGVATYAAERRVREFGIRLALGASERDVVQLVLHDGVLTALVGLAVGLAATVATTGFIERFLYGLASEAPLFMGIGLVVLFGATIGAGLAPALRASRTNPVETLRAE